MKHNNISIKGMSEEEDSEQGIENLFEEIVTKNLPNLAKKKDAQAPKPQSVQKMMDPKRPTPRHIIIKMAKLKDKEKILTATEEKQVVTYKEAPDRLSSDFSTNISGQNGRA